MIPILLSLSALLVAVLALLGVLRFLEASFRQQAMQVEEELKSESAEILRRAEELDAGLVEELVGSGDLGILIPTWQKERAALVRKIGAKPWEWGTQFLEDWREEERRARCGNLDEQLNKKKIVAAMVALGSAILCGIAVYATAAWSYFGSR